MTHQQDVSGGHDDRSADDSTFKIIVTPEPDADELVAILEVMHSLIDEDSESGHHAPPRSNWQRAALSESVRPVLWPPQAQVWESGE